MSTESHILLSNVIAETTGYGEKQKGAGYNRRSNGLHTVVYSVDAFNGSITIQGTLELFPGEADWVDITSYDFDGDSTIANVSTSYSDNFTGNFVWIRAKYSLTNGTIVSVRYNH
jgi:PKD repeat protein